MLRQVRTAIRHIPAPESPFPWIMWWAVLMHTSWGFSLIVDKSTTALVILVGLHWITVLDVSGDKVGSALVLISIVAAVALWLGRRLSNRTALLLVMPQQFVLVAAFFSDLQTIITGTVAGQQQSIDRLLLFTILWPMMVAAGLHSAALIERHRSWTRY